MVDPKILCRQHLLGEHLEIHMFVGAINKGMRLIGYIDNNLFELDSLEIRHSELVEEMLRRGYKHKSSLPTIRIKWNDNVTRIISKYKIDRDESLKDLLSRCKECKRRYENGTKIK